MHSWNSLVEVPQIASLARHGKRPNQASKRENSQSIVLTVDVTTTVEEEAKKATVGSLGYSLGYSL
jgi:hypothetical protein